MGSVAPYVLEHSLPLVSAAAYAAFFNQYRAYFDNPTESGARAVVRQMANKSFMEQLKHGLKTSDIDGGIIVVPHKVGSKNLLAPAFAKKVVGYLGKNFTMDPNIIQLPSHKKTHDLTKIDRLANPAVFAGEVEAGKPYILVDDNVTTGETALAFVRHIEEHGGKVEYIISLSSADGKNIDLKVSNQAVDVLTQKVSQLLGAGNEATKKIFSELGMNFNGFTALEAEYFSGDKGAKELIQLANARAKAHRVRQPH